ncbi:nuclear transport factor 2 family protein [Cryobacterium sp. CG_9.6]|uniref:nuclear transport factor 2 family protein n=1 Tax=Cryobacterium sp. CG_9.6 TaxID=2760710 RepID=UPI0024753703|nr:nuclear transport factor 2 family protein [Cryobacterium sp. CG_9.6]MDH6236728.1 ketosteroid isomerase-like protein [Cryobacterium sp. CG_9.6]
MISADGRLVSECTAVPTDGSLEALAAVDDIIDNFGHHRRDDYFAGFAPDATFLFYTHPHRLESRSAYERLWASWEHVNSFRVLACTSDNRHIQMFGHTAVFTHDVDTLVAIDGVTSTLLERESIILEQRNGAWICVHEHLSARTHNEQH